MSIEISAVAAHTRSRPMPFIESLDGTVPEAHFDRDGALGCIAEAERA
jgi:hypothetical protein